MRICVLTTSFPRFPGDEASVFVGRLMEAYSAIGSEGLVITPYDRSEALTERLGNFDIIRVKYGVFTRGSLAYGSGILPNIRSRPWLALQVFSLLGALIVELLKKRKSYQVVHANWLAAGVCAWLCSPFTKRPYIITLRGEDAKLLANPIMRVLLKPAICKAAKVIAVNETFKELLTPLTPADKIASISNGVSFRDVPHEELVRFKRDHNLSEQTAKIIFVGRLIPLKRVEVAIRLLSIPTLSNFELLICGRSDDQRYLQELQELRRSLALETRVHLLGSLPPSKIPALLACGEFFISASEHEGRPNSVLEAMAAGKVVLASDIAAHREIIRHAESGYLFNVDDLKSAAGILAGLNSDQATRERIGEAARSYARQFSWEGCALKYLEVLN
ncbi:MAG: hypothetical protein DCC75_01905 [Proteobacteria bacterium]|nr:MAG: hypothetical protein DCC75_01905 [Pseudomonadota bacterium]